MPMAGLALVSKVGARRDASGGVLRYDRPAELRQGIEDNLRSLVTVTGIGGSARPVWPCSASDLGNVPQAGSL
jgi:hypothetical protein